VQKGLYNRLIGPRRATSALRAVYQVKDGGREWTARFVSQAHAESRRERGGRACELGDGGGR
jgi:hypothetical protein